MTSRIPLVALLVAPVCAFHGGCATEAGQRTAPKAPASAAPEGAPPSEPPPSLALFEARLKERTARRAARAWRCWSGERCEAVIDDDGPAARDREAAEEVLRAGWRHDPRADALLRAAARVALEEAVSVAQVDEGRAWADAVLWDHEAPFSLVDLPALLVEAPRDRRAALLAKTTSLLEDRAARAASSEQAREEAAARAGLSEEALLSLRAGLEPGELLRLARRVLDETDAQAAELPGGPGDVPALGHAVVSDVDPESAWRGAIVDGIRAGRAAGRGAPLLACFLIEAPNDVRLEGDERASALIARYAKGCAAAGRWHAAGEPVDPLWVHAVATLFRDSAWPVERAARDPDGLRRLRQLRLLDLRRAAVEVTALLEGAAGDRARLDALATRWAAPGAAVVSGASALLAPRADGASVDALVASLVARELERSLTSQLGEGWARGEGEPVARILVELGAKWRREGPRAFLALDDATLSKASK